MGRDEAVAGGVFCGTLKLNGNNSGNRSDAPCPVLWVVLVEFQISPFALGTRGAESERCSPGTTAGQ